MRLQCQPVKVIVTQTNAIGKVWQVYPMAPENYIPADLPLTQDEIILGTVKGRIAASGELFTFQVQKMIVGYSQEAWGDRTWEVSEIANKPVMKEEFFSIGD